MEEDSDDLGSLRLGPNTQGHRADPSHLKIEAWLTPMSDHFPTPRGGNYLSAPILPSSPSTASGGGSSPTTFSNSYNRASTGTENTEFEDLYDVSDDEDSLSGGMKRPSAADQVDQMAFGQTLKAKQPARLVIPTNRQASEEHWSAMEEFKKIVTSPVPLTPSAQLPMSPQQMDFMGKRQAEEIPTISAPPSLDGSLSSEQLAAMSAPPTPVIGDDEPRAEEAWAGVHLQPGALATLQSLSGEVENPHEQPSQVLEFQEESSRPIPEMRQATPPQSTTMRHQSLRLFTSILPTRPDQAVSPHQHRQSLADLTKLDIPSPGGFFSGLSPRSRNTWHLPSRSPDDVVPPTSTTAEQFYKCPWNSNVHAPVPKRPDSAEGFYRSLELSSSSSLPVEQVVEAQDDLLNDDMPTARPVIAHKDSGSSEETIKASISPVAEDAPTEIVVDYDPNYARKQQKEALSNFDRTETWLFAQRVYLKGTDAEEEEGALQTIAEDIDEEEMEKPTKEVVDDAEPKGKTVRFSNIITTTAPPKRLPSKFLRQESAYYRAFQEYIVRTQLRDVFTYQAPRFEALQAQRVALRNSHRSQLLGKYQLSVLPQSAKKRLSANVVRGDDTLLDDPEKLRLEKEFEALNQMRMSTWHVAATKLLNGGSLTIAPVGKRLGRLSGISGGKTGSARDRPRILDLGGQAACDWAWHCALQFPSTKIYTVTTKAIRQMSNANIRGPPNHRQVAVERFTRLPFPDEHFDLVSARELHSILKFIGENGEDEWESCVRECMRVLKPGGYLEFSVLDSDIVNAGPMGLAKSVEFGFALKTLGYDPSPTKMWLGRLDRAGFENTRRAWVCLPVGAKRNIHKFAPPPPPKGGSGQLKGKTCQLEAMVMGNTENIANVCSVVGGWSWERWLLRCEMEKVAGELRLADTVTTGAAMEEAGKCLGGVHAVMEEGRNCNASFRMLNGYAMKPKTKVEEIRIALVDEGLQLDVHRL